MSDPRHSRRIDAPALVEVEIVIARAPAVCLASRWARGRVGAHPADVGLRSCRIGQRPPAARRIRRWEDASCAARHASRCRRRLDGRERERIPGGNRRAIRTVRGCDGAGAERSRRHHGHAAVPWSDVAPRPRVPGARWAGSARRSTGQLSRVQGTRPVDGCPTAHGTERAHAAAARAGESPVGRSLVARAAALHSAPGASGAVRDRRNRQRLGRRVAGVAERDEVEELLRHVFGEGAVPKDAVALLFGWTRGNPFFLEQTLNSLVATGRLTYRDGTWVGWDLEGLKLPRSIRDALEMRLGLLGPDARRVADCAAVIGTRLTADILCAATGMDSASLLAALDELCRRNVISGQLFGERVEYDFTHPMVRATLYQGLGIGRRSILHAQVADALER